MLATYELTVGRNLGRGGGGEEEMWGGRREEEGRSGRTPSKRLEDDSKTLVRREEEGWVCGRGEEDKGKGVRTLTRGTEELREERTATKKEKDRRTIVRREGEERAAQVKKNEEREFLARQLGECGLGGGRRGGRGVRGLFTPQVLLHYSDSHWLMYLNVDLLT